MIVRPYPYKSQHKSVVILGSDEWYFGEVPVTTVPGLYCIMDMARDLYVLNGDTHIPEMAAHDFNSKCTTKQRTQSC